MTDPTPQLPNETPSLRDTLQILRSFWNIGAAMIPLYGLIALAVEATAFTAPRRFGFFHVNSDDSRTIYLLSAAIAVGIGQPILWQMLANLHRAVDAIPDGKDASMMVADQLRRRFLWMFRLCDATAFMGFMVFLATGNWRALAFLLGVATISFIQALPKLSWIPERLRSDA